jgi:opacity protein-like surface antigen
MILKPPGAMFIRTTSGNWFSATANNACWRKLTACRSEKDNPGSAPDHFAVRALCQSSHIRPEKPQGPDWPTGCTAPPKTDEQPRIVCVGQGVGAETDLQWSGIRASSRSNVSEIDFFPPGDSPAFTESSSTSQINIRQNWFGTTRLRLGYQAFDRVLAYATGGIAYAGFSADTSGALSGATIFDTEHGSTSGSGSSTRIGWTAGAGVEYAIAENLSFKSEYLYSQYSGFDFPYQRSLVLDTFVNDTTQGTLSTGTLGIHLVRAGLNWKLGEPGH